jgi:hypothetical protein
MSKLNSKFDIVTVDNPMAAAALAQVLDVSAASALNTNGTPVAGAIPAGSIVKMDAAGKAVLATTTNVTTGDLVPVFVTIDGNDDYSGSFVWKLTVLQGGFTMVTDLISGSISGFTPGVLVSFTAGLVKVAATNDQVIGYVGPAGADTVNGTVQIVVPQGLGGVKK